MKHYTFAISLTLALVFATAAAEARSEHGRGEGRRDHPGQGHNYKGDKGSERRITRGRIETQRYSNKRPVYHHHKRKPKVVYYEQRHRVYTPPKHHHKQDIYWDVNLGYYPQYKRPNYGSRIWYQRRHGQCFRVEDRKHRSVWVEVPYYKCN